MAVTSSQQLEVSPPQKLTRRRFLRNSVLGGGAAAVGLAAYSGLIETNEVEVKKLDLRVQRLAPAFDGFKLALISDFHFGPYTGAGEIGAAVRAVNALKVDVVTLLGDFVTEPFSGPKKLGARKAGPCAEVLSGLRSRLGSFAVLGNHDYSTDPEFVADALRSHGITVLRNSSSVFEKEGGKLSLLGLNDAVESAADIHQAMADIPLEDPKIVLVHEPDIADYTSQFGIDVQFSGHSHGGQIRIPGVRPMWLPPLAHKYYRGYYRVRRLQLYTNQGIGTVGMPFRFCCPPEVTLVTLRAA